MDGAPAAFVVMMAREVGVPYRSGNILQREHPRIELTLRYAPPFARVAWDDPVFDDTYRWCDTVRDRAMARDAGWLSWAWYEDGALEICLRGVDLERLWGGDRAGGGRAAGPGGLGRVDPAGGGAGDAERAAVAEVVG